MHTTPRETGSPFKEDSAALSEIATCRFGNPDADERIDWLHQIVDASIGWVKKADIPDNILMEGTVACTVHGLMRDYAKLKESASPFRQADVDPSLSDDEEFVLRLTAGQVRNIQKLLK